MGHPQLERNISKPGNWECNTSLIISDPVSSHETNLIGDLGKLNIAHIVTINKPSSASKECSGQMSVTISAGKMSLITWSFWPLDEL